MIPPARPGTVLAVDLGGTEIKAELSGPHQQVLAAASRATPRADGAAVLAAVCELARQVIGQAPEGGTPGIVGLAVPGIVDTVTGTGVMSANLGWKNAPVARTVTHELGLPVVVVHDVTAAGLAEHRLGAGLGSADVLVVVLGTGVAAALVVGGHLVTGGLGQAGELGHVMVRPDGVRCGCGRRGCLETVSSAAAIASAYTRRTGRAVDGASQVHELLGSDPVADEVWREAVEALADGVLSALALLGSSRVVIGGGLSRAGDGLLDPLRKALAERCTVETVPEVVAASLGARAGLVGAALVARDPQSLAAVVHQP